MHIGVCISRAVCRDQQFRAFKERSLCRKELDLAGPLVQTGDRTVSCCDSFGLRCFFPLKLLHLGARTSTGRMLSSCRKMRHHCLLALCFVFDLHDIFNSHLFPSLLCRLYSSFIISRSLTLLKADRTCRTIRKTITETIAEILSDQFGLSIYDVDGSLMAGAGA